MFGKPRRGKGGRPGPLVHDDRVDRVFAAAEPNRLWLTDLTEHRAAEGKLYALDALARLTRPTAPPAPG